MGKDIIKTLTRPWIKEFLAKPWLARLATCNPNTLQPHVVPVWYEWDGESLWISSFHSTRKVREIGLNPKIAVTVDTGTGNDPTRGVLFEGEAVLIEDPLSAKEAATSIYTRYLGPEGVLEAEPQSWMNDPEHLVIKLTPQWAHAWGGD